MDARRRGARARAHRHAPRLRARRLRRVHACSSTASPCAACLVLAVQAAGRRGRHRRGPRRRRGDLHRGPAGVPPSAARCSAASARPASSSSPPGSREREPDADEERIREVLSSNLCRCTGYAPILAATVAAMRAPREGAAVRLRARRVARRGARAARRRPATRRSCSPAARASCRCSPTASLRPTHLVDIDGAGGLARHRRDGEDVLELGALVRHARLERSRAAPAPSACWRRRPGTSGTCRSARAARSAAASRTPTRPPSCRSPLLALDAPDRRPRRARGERRVAAAEFFRGPVHDRARPRRGGRGASPSRRRRAGRVGAFAEFAVRAGDFALAVGGGGRRSRRRTVASPARGSRSAASTPRRFARRTPRRCSMGAEPGDDAIAAAAAAAAAECDPASDHHERRVPARARRACSCATRSCALRERGARRVIASARARRARRDAELVTGRARYVADVSVPGQPCAPRRPQPGCARDADRRRRRGGARAAGRPRASSTAADVPDVRIPIRLAVRGDAARPESALQPPLARDVVRYVGEPVALVVAEDPWTAEDAAELVELDLDPLDPCVDPVAGAGEAAPLVHEALGVERRQHDPDPLRRRRCRLRRAPTSSSGVASRVQRQTGAPMETRGLLAEPVGDGRLTLWGAAKVKHFNRGAIAALLGLDPAPPAARRGRRRRRLRRPRRALPRGRARPVRGAPPRSTRQVDRGSRRAPRRHEPRARAGARDRGRRDGGRPPARIRGDRAGSTRAPTCARRASCRRSLAGAPPPRARTSGRPSRSTAHAVLTNRTPVGTYRGPGMTEAAFVRERMLDLVAGELGLDPVELRRRNLVPADRMPFVYDLGASSRRSSTRAATSPAFFERLLAEAGTPSADPARAPPGARGVGVAASVELGGDRPVRGGLRRPARPTARSSCGRASARSVRASRPCSRRSRRRSSPSRSSASTCATTTRTTSPSGFGSFASRSTVRRRKRRRARAAARSELAHAERGSRARRDRLTRRVASTRRTRRSRSALRSRSSPSTRETGRVTPLRHVVAHDVGRAVNPALVRGQLAGRRRRASPARSSRSSRTTTTGQPLAVSLADYLMPTAAELPDVRRRDRRAPGADNPLGVKGAGEAGMSGAPAAVANAVADGPRPGGRRRRHAAAHAAARPRAPPRC